MKAISTHQLAARAAMTAVLSVLAGCGGGGTDSTSPQASASELDAQDMRSVTGERARMDHPDDLKRPDELLLSADELDEMEKVERQALLEKIQAGPGTAARQAAAAPAAGFSVGFINEDVGPLGQALRHRAGGKERALAARAAVRLATASEVPDVLYVRAGSVSARALEDSPVFRRVIAGGKAVVVEREASGSQKFEGLMRNAFHFVPPQTGAVLVRRAGDESHAVVLLDDEDDAPAAAAASGSSDGPRASAAQWQPAPLDRLAAIVAPPTAARPADAFAFDEPAQQEISAADGELADAQAAASRLSLHTFVLGTSYYIKDGSGNWVRDTRPDRETWLVDARGGWVTRADQCNQVIFGKKCNGYGKTVPHYGAWQPRFKRVEWWDDWTICGRAEVVRHNHCLTTYETRKATIKGVTQGVSAEAGVSVSVEGSLAFLGFAKKKIETTIHAKAGYEKQWQDSTETSFLARYNSQVIQGYSTRFGRGDYSMMVPHWFHGRHERDWPMEMYFYTGNSGACETPADGPGYEFGTDGRVTYKLSCWAAWNPEFLQRVQLLEMKSFGARVWAICKNTDSRCFQIYNQGTAAERSKLFPL